MPNQLTITPLRDALDMPMSDRAREYISASKAANTVRAYRAAWREFQAFCAQHGARAKPASPATIIEYLTALAERT